MTDSDRSDLADGYGIEIDGVRVAWVKDGTYHFSPPPEDSSVPTEFEGAVPIGVLEDLVEEWREHGEIWHKEAPTHALKRAGLEMKTCADELQDVIQDYGDTDE